MGESFPIRVVRVYQDTGEVEGTRLFVDRLWPRGIRKADFTPDAWLKNLAPGHELRRWFHADRSRFPEFREQYLAQLRDNPDLVEEALAYCRKGPVVLLTSESDPSKGHTDILRDYLEQHIRAEHRAAASAAGRP